MKHLISSFLAAAMLMLGTGHAQESLPGTVTQAHAKPRAVPGQLLFLKVAWGEGSVRCLEARLRPGHYKRRRGSGLLTGVEARLLDAAGSILFLCPIQDPARRHHEFARDIHDPTLHAVRPTAARSQILIRLPYFTEAQKVELIRVTGDSTNARRTSIGGFSIPKLAAPDDGNDKPVPSHAVDH